MLLAGETQAVLNRGEEGSGDICMLIINTINQKQVALGWREQSQAK